MPSPSPAQVAFARDLGIENPEAHDREELRWMIKVAQEQREAFRVQLKTVTTGQPAAVLEDAVRASERASETTPPTVATVGTRADDPAFFEAMAKFFERELERWSTREAAIRATVFRFDYHEVLRHHYPAAVLEAIKETSWGGLDE